jgi:hypothetical protein
MNVTIKLRDDQPELLKQLKMARRTWNNNQIFREALYEYAEKILPDRTHKRVNKKESTELHTRA